MQMSLLVYLFCILMGILSSLICHKNELDIHNSSEDIHKNVFFIVSKKYLFNYTVAIATPQDTPATPSHFGHERVIGVSK